ncbi:hypothetical protein PAPYR_11733 [Paratrimastix pyriformis]|uniref:Uncharacterized protein n=1 Tax=Paratrimastix pyriformis TaxID=342808 RepID=A0ABQ8U6X4_9EUKA|nr:hypothetical protein PAPYR_11733 [Paratrimastix pyriformis]
MAAGPSGAAVAYLLLMIKDELRLAHALLASLGKFWSNNNSADEEKTSRRENPVSWTPLSGSVSGLT